MDDFIPGDPMNAEVADATQGLAEVTQLINEAESVIDDTDAAIIVPVIEEIKDAEALCIEIEGVCIGEVEIAVSEAEELLGKVKGKITDDMDSLLGDIYSDMGLLGFDVPSSADLAYMEATGNNTPLANEPVEETGPRSEPGLTSGSEVIIEPLLDCTPRMIPYGTPCPTGYVLISRNSPHGFDQCVPAGCVPESECPDGYHFEPSGEVETVVEMTPVAMAGRGPNPLSVLPCDPPVTNGWLEVYQPSMIAAEGGQFAHPPWLSANPAILNPPSVQECISGCHLRPPQTGERCFNLPANMQLYVRPSDGHLVAATYQPAGYERPVPRPQFQPPYPPGPIAVPGGNCVPDNTPIGKCPAPDVLCKPEGEFPGFPSDDKSDDVCKEIEDAIKRLEERNFQFKDFIGWWSGNVLGLPLADAIINAITGGSEPIFVALARRFVEWAQSTVSSASNSLACASPAMLQVTLKMAIMKFIQKWTDILPEQVLTATEQVSNTICQSRLPSGENADVAYLADQASTEMWECWQKAEGNHLAEAKKLMLSKRTRVSASQADLLYRRKKIEWEEMRKRMRAAGVVSDDDMFDIRELNEHQPTVTDIIAWMKRDVFDAEAVESLKLDEDFDKKFPGEAEKLADAIGLKKEHAKNSWRAHWHNPSYSMAREFLHRLNDPDLPENIRFDETAMRELLKYDDWVPGHIDRMIANAYHPVTRIDVVKAFMIHAMSEDEFVKRFKKTGYTEDDTRFYLEYYKKRRLINDRKSSGFPTFRTAVNSYARCELTERQFADISKKIAIDDDQRNNAIEAARTAREVWERKQTIRTVKRPYLLGIYDEQTARDELNRSDVDPACAASLIEQWNREKLRRDKFLSASQLCQMYERGIITETQMMLALVRSGWEENSAALIAANCGAMISEKIAKKARIESERQLKELRRIQREQEKARRLAECGPPPCPANRFQNGNLSGADQ
jgi:hypothetical protein